MLMVEQLQKSFGGVAALDGCSFNAAESHITAIIGPNGAGKSTLLNCISGATKPDRGRITLFDNNVTAEKPHRLARAGLARTFQISRELSSLTLLENVLLAQQSQSDEHFFAPIFLRGRILKEEKEATQRAMQLLTRVGLER
ncbi:MAG TPA: ABC transporter ATP-binding protein, partial [Rhodospirillaceae bacterium]|nr:ABC transporter ATP-binding protein [Rhodospirillaceae bacterium]